MVDFGIRLRAIRLEHHLTQQQLASRVGITKSMVSAYETGTRYPSYDILIKLAGLFGVTTDHLLGITKERTISAEGLTKEEVEVLCNLADLFRKKSVPEETL